VRQTIPGDRERARENLSGRRERVKARVVKRWRETEREIGETNDGTVARFVVKAVRRGWIHANKGREMWACLPGYNKARHGGSYTRV